LLDVINILKLKKGRIELTGRELYVEDEMIMDRNRAKEHKRRENRLKY
jgi:hypothetical protein